MDTSDQYLDCLCRTCLNEVDSFSNGTNTRPQQWQFIFDRIEECGALRIAELLSLAVPQMEMLQSDELPKKVCCKCLQELLSAYRFQQMCVRSEEQMRAIVSTKESDVKISMEAASKERELVTNDTEAAHSSSTHQTLEQPSVQEPLHEITQQITEAKAVQSSSLENINKLLEACKDEDEEVRFNEFLKNEPPKDGGVIMHSTISVLSMEYEEARIHNERIESEAAQSSAIDHLQSIDRLMEYCKDSQGEFSEFIKSEHSKEDTRHSTISIERKEEQLNVSQNERIEPEAAKSSAADHLQSIDQLMEHCKDSQGEFSEFIKSEHSKEDTRHSTISIERKEEQANASQDAIIEPQEAQSSAPNQLENIDQLPEHCNDSQGEFSECMKNEPIDDDEPNIEYSDGDTIQSTISVTKEEVLAMECEEGQTNLISPRHHHEKKDNGDVSGERDSTHSDTSIHISITHSIDETNTEPILKQHACTSCDKSFKSAAALKRHVCTHTGERVECEKASSLSRIIADQRTTYIEDNPYECPYCPLRFTSKSGASRHKTVHGGAAKRRLHDDLKNRKPIHNKEKPHKCDLCEKRFSYQQRLQIHIRTHTVENPYKCKYCERGYMSVSLLNRHLRTHLGKNIYRCKFCPLAFPSSKERCLHLTSHKNDDPATRQRNLKALEEEEAKLVLKFPKERSEGQATEEQHQQEMSEKEIEQPSTEKEGNNRTQTSEKPHKCDICEKRFIRIQQLRVHKRIHTGEKPETRERNMKALREEDATQQSKDRITRGENKPYECTYCPLRFTSKQGMKNHKEIHEGIKLGACDICGKQMGKRYLNIHKLIHSKEKLHKCDFCGKRFMSIAGLRFHSRKHTGEKPFKCKYCECAFIRPNLRTQHLRSHLGDNIYRCEFCPSAFPLASERRSQLLSHKNEDPETRERNIKALQEDEAKLRLQISKEKTQQPSTEESAEESDEQLKEYITHSENKPYECPYCPLRFRTKRTVREHKEIHEGVKLAACDICGKKVRKRNLNIHKRTHREEKLHECDLCEKRFISTQRLRIHRRRHAGEKRFKCKYCKRAYSESTTLNSHLRTHLGVNVFRCEFCPLGFPSSSERRLHLPSHKNEDPATRERNINALREDEAKLRLIAKEKISSCRQKTSS